MLPDIDNFYDRLVYAKNLSCSRVRWSTLADEIGISKANFSRYKNRDYFPSAVTLLKLSRVLGVDAKWLAGDDINITDCGIPLLTDIYELLDDDGREELIEYAEQLLSSYSSIEMKEE